MRAAEARKIRLEFILVRIKDKASYGEGSLSFDDPLSPIQVFELTELGYKVIQPTKSTSFKNKTYGVISW